MFKKFAKFFIQNPKLTIVIIIVTLLSWIGSYIIIPKQYNPTIVVPAFQVLVEAKWLNSDESKRFITDELENKIMELEEVDEVYWNSQENYSSVMVKFQVGTDKEKAKIRLLQKLSENLDLKPIWASTPIVKAIDPDELPQIVYAINKQKTSSWSFEDSWIYLRQTANLIKSKLKTLENVTTFEIIWWLKKDLIIELDLKKLEELSIDINQVYSVIKANNIDSPVWNLNISGEKSIVSVSWNLDSIEKLKKLIIAKNEESIITLWDLANIRFGTKKITSFSSYSDKTWNYDTVFLWIGKKVGTNAVFVTEDISKKIEEIKKELPKDIIIKEISNEWAKAKEATGHLIKDLIESIIIVVVILVMFLGFRNAINTATSIPLILSLVFLFAFIAWENINRITLFALILVIWMLVDDSIVVVENIDRHLEERLSTGKTKLEAILTAVWEVWTGVVLSTVTKVLSFGAMFSVTWMMWEYMWPIPKFWIIALLLSIIVAFSINPFVSFFMAKDLTEEDKSRHLSSQTKKNSRFDIRIIYVKIMWSIINSSEKSKKYRKLFKVTFWISLVLIIILPIYFGIFKARMLPKSNQNQVYVWIDWIRWDSASKMLNIEKDLKNFLLNNKDLKKDLNIVESVSSSIWDPLSSDFANLFRWWSERKNEFQISSRINLIPKEEHKDRIKSEVFTYEIRPLLISYLKEKYPDIKIRLLEDPPGPPVRATLLLKIKSESTDENLNNFTNKVYNELGNISKKEKVVDLWNSYSSTYRKFDIKINSDDLLKAWLNLEQVVNSLWIAVNSMSISTYKDKNSLEATNLVLWIKTKEEKEILDRTNFINSLWQKIPLSTFASIEYSFVDSEINTDKRQKTNYIYAEMWDNSVIYPIIKMYSLFGKSDFLNWEYKRDWFSFYSIDFIWLKDWKKYSIEWDWEWKLTMDTFRDLGTAMILAILAIYFLIVWQFRSFKVAWIIMLPFLLWFFGIFPGFSLLYIFKNEYFNATWMIWIISLAWIVVWNAILLLDYVNILKQRWWTIEKALIEAAYIRFMPIMLTSLSAIFWAIKITGDPVWSWLARSIVCGLSASAILTLIIIPIFYYDSQRKNW